MPSRRIDRALHRGLVLCVPMLAGSVLAQPKAADIPLDEVGYAAVLEEEPASAIRGAHRALPTPSYVEVTALTTGRTILVEINGNGTATPGKVIDLSCGAIRQLGLSSIPAAVRVRRVSPPEQEKAALAAGHAAAARLDAPEGLLSALRRKVPPSAPASRGAGDCALQPRPEKPGRLPDAVLPSELSASELPSKPAPINPVAPKPAAPKAAPSPPTVQPPKGPVYVIQVAALSNRARADALARSIDGYVEGTGSVFRVRKGPYASETAARAALPSIRAKGFADARVMPNEGR